MAEVYFLGDTHFGHHNILKYRPEFKTIKEHDDFIINNINKVVTKRDKLILTGDICFNRESMDCLRRIRCPAIHVLLGNHDDYNLDFRKEVNGVCWVSGDFKYKEFWVSHIPLHPEELRGKFNIHAHMHRSTLKDKKRYFSTSCE
ncbi:UNVERIFIED_CONTAM: metallophosphoesterase, partial [Kocuria sp. CPCC 205274]